MTDTTINPNIQNLLSFTKTHQRHHEALLRVTGGHFNLFQVLGIGHYEVKTHSPILAELLNPKGSHGQGEVFLKLFLNILGIEDKNFDAKSSIVTSEYHIGFKTEDTGGRIDIVIQDANRRQILIENKIYASDQENQVIRYRNYDKKARLFYLTLTGKTPSNLTNEEAEKIRCESISYEKHILEWLELCRKEAACLPTVRETISQYIALIEELTHKSTTKEMNKDLIKEITGSKESLNAFFALTKVQWEVKIDLIGLLDAQLDKIAANLLLVREERCVGMDEKDGTIYFTNEHLKSLGVCIIFQFERASYQDLYFAYYPVIPDHASDAMKSLNESFKDTFGDGCFELPYRYWDDQAFEGIRSGDLAKNMQSKLETLIEIAKVVFEDHCAKQISPNPSVA